MLTKITKDTLSGLKASGKVQFVRDTKLIGFGVKVSEAGRATYIAEKRIKGGRVVRKTIGEVSLLPLDQAREEAREVLLQLSKGIDVARVEPEDEDSLQSHLTQYLALRRHKLKPSTVADYQKVMQNCFSDWLPLKATDITDKMVALRYALLRDKHSEDYTNKAMRTLKAILNSAGIAPNPVNRAMKKGGLRTSSSAKTRYLSDDEIVKVMEYAEKEPFGKLLMFYLCTGCRKNEALNFEVHGDQLTFKNTKSGKDHTIPIVGLIEANHGPFVYTDTQWRNELDKAREALGFKQPWTVHDLRRTFAEHAQLAGVDVGAIGIALNHTPIGVTRTSYLGGGLAKKMILTQCLKTVSKQYLAYMEGETGIVGEEVLDAEAVLQMLRDAGLKLR
ncbi:integrase family protein [Tabrizicola sp.]|uniref:integrase family protein n=1 Tax=Tabrizicola sp. TaxID=2005166 RepID=UPI0026335B7C|nr:integrase family protein [Tabrizicola sp.]MDM7932870.1 integrase family protein [Tabrizicola sp.]